jgi:CPA2 family monovalent cation:H+ antiporter-2
MLGSIVKLVFFLILWFVSGIFFLPTIIKRIKKHLNDELLLIISLALCFLMVILSAQAGFSPALGAFIMGSILAETPIVEKIEHAIISVKDLFGAVFFVSVGMLLDPNMLVEYALPIGISVLVLLIWKPLFATIGALVAGQPIKVAVQSGMSLSQIGEFSFIIASLGTTLKVTSDFLYPIAVAVSVITTFTTPYMIGFSGRFSDWIAEKIPSKWSQKLNQYSLGTQQVKQASDWKKILRFYLINTVIFSVVIISLIFLSDRFFNMLFEKSSWRNPLVVGLTLLITLPFLYALAFRRGSSSLYTSIWSRPIYRGPLIALMFSRLILALFFVGFIFAKHYSIWYALLGVLVTVLLSISQRFRIKNFYKKIESRFLQNLNDRERRELEKEAEMQVLAPWDAHLAKFTIGPNSPLIGKPLFELKIRERFGVNVVIIERGEKIINIPARSEMIYPFDVVSVIGTDEQMEQFETFLNESIESSVNVSSTAQVGLHSFTLMDKCTLVGKSIRDSKIRERCHGIVVGLERDENRIVNPEPETVFHVGDTLWLVGINKRIHLFLKEVIQQDNTIKID